MTQKGGPYTKLFNTLSEVRLLRSGGVWFLDDDVKPEQQHAPNVDADTERRARAPYD